MKLTVNKYCTLLGVKHSLSLIEYSLLNYRKTFVSHHSGFQTRLSDDKNNKKHGISKNTSCTAR